MDCDCAATVFDGAAAVVLRHQSGTVRLADYDIAVYPEVFEGGILGVAERGAPFLVGGAHGYNQQMPAAVEGTFEGVVGGAYHGVDGIGGVAYLSKVVGHDHGFAFVGVGTAVDGGCKGIPVGFGTQHEVGLPLDKVGLARLDGGDVAAHCQRQLITGLLAADEGFHDGAFERGAGEVVDVEGQAEGVPAAVVVEGVAVEDDGRGWASRRDGRSVVGIGCQMDEGRPVGGVGAGADGA